MEQIDLTQLDSDQSLEIIISTFNNLAAGDFLIITNNDTNEAVLKNFQKEFWGKFDFQPLAAAANNWKARIIKRVQETDREDIHHFMTIDHGLCDHLYADGEAAILEENTELGKELLKGFALCMDRHFTMEEDILFPTFEQRSGMTGGPTQVMRMEHDQMRNVLKQMSNAVDSDDFDTALGAGETMLILMQQHNMKEEGMLYPMADSHISDISENMLKTMQLIRA